MFCDSGRAVSVPAVPSDARAPRHGDRPLKILVLIPTLEIGGAEMDLVRNLPHLDRSRFTPVVCPLTGQVTLSAQLSNAGVGITALNLEVLPAKAFMLGRSPH